MKTRQKQRIVILTLGAVILGLVLGYAALSQVLNINGTSSISGDFNIQIVALDENTMNHAQTVSKTGLGNDNGIVYRRFRIAWSFGYL